MSHITALLFTGIIAGDVLFLRETSDLLIGFVLILYMLVYKHLKNPRAVSIEVSMVSLIFMYISFLRYQHGPMTERFAVWMAIFLITTLVTQGYELILHRKKNRHIRL